MDTIEGQSTEIEIAYEPDYTIEDIMLFEPFVVMKPVGIKGYAWWSDRSKVENLIAAFKMDLTIQEACIQAGISLTQYKYFCKVHSSFVAIKGRFKAFGPMVAKQGLIADLKHPQGFRSRQWYLERKQPHIYGRDIGAYTPPPPEAASKVTAEAYLDEDGKMIISKQTREILKQEHGDISNEDGESPAKTGV